MTRKFFGTDGIRGVANSYPMTADVALKLAQATAVVLNRGDHRHKVVIGKDTRLSGYMLEPALVAGFISMGLDVVLVGPIPTPAIAMLTKSLRADLGVMISASHNPFQDNGIKLFAADGYKLSDQMELDIEAHIEKDLSDKLVASEKLGKARRLEDASGRYIEFVKNTLPKGLRLDGLKVVIDCAHGAAYKVAPEILYELGAEVIPIGVSPDGMNINHFCGATSTNVLSETVVIQNADIGIALDGDADRIIVCDEKGQIVDGDQLMAVLAQHLKSQGQLRHNTLAATVMSNLGLERFCETNEMTLIRTSVGDRYVVEAMRRDDIALGGEQSGHIILLDHGTTGDGLVAALGALAVLRGTDKPASEALQMFTPVPQLLKNIRVRDKAVLNDPVVVDYIASQQKDFEGQGRILVRASGTEQLVRVMVEGDDAEKIKNLSEAIADFILNCDEAAAA